MLNNMQMQTGVGSGKPNPVKDRACNCQILLKGLGEKMKDGMKKISQVRDKRTKRQTRQKQVSLDKGGW
jgi:hypothetical protein